MSENGFGVGPSQPRKLPKRRFQLGILGVGSIVLFAVLANALAVRFDQRWDVTADKRYTPAPALREILHHLRGPVIVVVLLSRADPLSPTIEQLLLSYRSESRLLTVDWVDPDRDETRFLSKQAELGIAAGRTEDGQVTTDALLVLVSKSQKYFLTVESIAGLDPEHSDSGASFEHAFAVGLKSLFREQKPQVCFTLGHRELSISDQSPVGISRFKERLERDALSSKSVDLTTEGSESLASCSLIVIPSPDVPLSERAISLLRESVTARSNLLLLGGVVPNSDGKLQSVGFEPLAKLAGIELLPSIVVEYDYRFRLPNLFGETFFATPAEHAINRGLMRGSGDAPLRVVVSLAPSLSALSGSRALPLLLSSRKTLVFTDVSDLSRAKPEPDEAKMSSHIVAISGQVERVRGTAGKVVLAPTNLVQNRSFEAPALVVTQAFTESVVSWLVAEPGQEVEYLPRSERPRGLELSRSEFHELLRYVLFVMPSAVLLLGLGVYLRRRNDGRRARSRDTREGRSS